MSFQPCGVVKYKHKNSVSQHKTLKTRSTKFSRMQPPYGFDASWTGTTRQGTVIKQPATPTLTHIWNQSLRARHYIILTRIATAAGTQTGPTHYYREFCRQQEHDKTDPVSSHIRKSKPDCQGSHIILFFWIISDTVIHFNLNYIPRWPWLSPDDWLIEL